MDVAFIETAPVGPPTDGTGAVEGLAGIAEGGAVGAGPPLGLAAGALETPVLVCSGNESEAGWSRTTRSIPAAGKSATAKTPSDTSLVTGKVKELPSDDMSAWTWVRQS